MPKALVCPDLLQFQRLASGKLPGPEEEILLQHLGNCDGCAEKSPRCRKKTPSSKGSARRKPGETALRGR